MYTRHATHAGSWYESRNDLLSSQLCQWLDEAKCSVEMSRPMKTRAIIGNNTNS
jgi:predicted class III extradiol MEMO1 family dioxygenase